MLSAAPSQGGKLVTCYAVVRYFTYLSSAVLWDRDHVLSEVVV